MFNGQHAFTFYSFVLGFAIPLMLILIFYILVIIKLKTVGPKNKSREKKKSHRKVTKGFFGRIVASNEGQLACELTFVINFSKEIKLKF